MAKLDIKFVDEMGNNLNRYKAIDVNTGAEYVFDLSRNGTITIPGTPLNAEIMNAIIEAINSIDLVNNVIQQKVLCPHRYEITGDTGNEHGLAIEDQQMLLDRIQGRTLVKNQLINKSNLPQTQTINGITFTNNGDGSFTVNGTTNSEIASIIIPIDLEINSSHKYFLRGCPSGGGVNKYLLDSSIGGYDEGEGKILNTSNLYNPKLTIIIYGGVTVSNLKFIPQLIDLTLKYGAGKEPTTVEQVLNDMQGYEEYDEGSFIHSKNNLISTGRNVWDEEWELGTINQFGELQPSNTSIRSKNIIRCSSGQECFVTDDNANVIITFYDNNNNKINYTGYGAYQNCYGGGSHTFTTPQNTAYMRFRLSSNYGTTYNHDICINVSDESFNGKYEPYQEDVMVVNEELKAFEYIDNITNEKVNKGKLVDLGTLDYAYTGSYFYANIRDGKTVPANVIGNIRCTKYPTVSAIDCYSGNAGNSIAGIDEMYNVIYIYDSNYTDAATFKQAMSGVMLYYETTTETREPLQLPRGMTVTKYGMQIQQGTIPYLLTKTYSLNIRAQVKANIQIDKEQQAQINELKNQNKTKVFEMIADGFVGGIGQTLISLPNTFLDLVNRYDELNFQFVVENENQLDINNYTISTYFVKKMIIHGFPIRYLMGNVYVQFGANGETDIENSYTIVFEHKDGKEIADGEITGIR